MNGSQGDASDCSTPHSKDGIGVTDFILTLLSSRVGKTQACNQGRLSLRYQHKAYVMACATPYRLVTLQKTSRLAQVRELLEEAGIGKQNAVLGGATVAGFFAAACSLPFDFVKTRMQKMTRSPDGTFPYSGPLDCAAKTLRQEGFLTFYTGFPTYCIRYGCTSVVAIGSGSGRVIPAQIDNESQLVFVQGWRCLSPIMSATCFLQWC